MNLFRTAMTAVVLVAALPTGQAASANPNPSNVNGNSRGRSSDDDWNEVVALTLSPVVQGNSARARRTNAQAAAEAREKAERAREAASAARAFYTANPTHINAREARKLEALMSLQGTIDGDTAQEAAAQQLASSYRASTATPSERFEVACLSERVRERASLGGTYGTVPAVLEQIADRLLAEFGDLADAYYFYASVARTADMARAGRMADRLLRAGAAPADAKAEARSIRAKLDLLGTTFSTQLRATDGATVDLSRLAGKVTVLYVWPYRAGTDGLAALRAVRRSLPANVQLVYFPLGATSEQARGLESQRPIAGPICSDTQAAPATVGDLLRIQHAPFVYVLDRAAKLQSFGPAAQVRALVEAASQ